VIDSSKNLFPQIQQRETEWTFCCARFGSEIVHSGSLENSYRFDQKEQIYKYVDLPSPISVHIHYTLLKYSADGDIRVKIFIVVQLAKYFASFIAGISFYLSNSLL